MLKRDYMRLFLVLEATEPILPRVPAGPSVGEPRASSDETGLFLVVALGHKAVDMDWFMPGSHKRQGRRENRQGRASKPVSPRRRPHVLGS